MLDASCKVAEFISGKRRADLDTDEQLCLAVTRLLEIVGEAACALTDAFKISHDDIPWHAIVGTRNRLIHGYFDVDNDILWNIASRDLPPLVSSLKKFLE